MRVAYCEYGRVQDVWRIVSTGVVNARGRMNAGFAHTGKKFDKVFDIKA